MAMFQLCLRMGFMPEIFRQSFGSGALSSEKLRRMLGPRCSPAQAAPIRRRFCVGAMEDRNTPGALAGYRVVLVSPQGSGNVGSVCRLAANFECEDVWLVDPQCDFTGPVGHAMAANAVSRTLLANVRVTSTLAEALDDCHVAVAFTRRSGAERIPDMLPTDLPVPVNKSVIALVFGREDSGLSNNEVLQCNHICSIPSGNWAGSLNLSHAVAVVLSRLFDSASQHAYPAPKVPLDSPTYSWTFKSSPGSASIGEIENLLARWTGLIVSLNRAAAVVGKPEYQEPERFVTPVRKLLQRAAPSCREVAYLQGFLTLVANVCTMMADSEEKTAPKTDPNGLQDK